MNYSLLTFIAIGVGFIASITATTSAFLAAFPPQYEVWVFSRTGRKKPVRRLIWRRKTAMRKLNSTKRDRLDGYWHSAAVLHKERAYFEFPGFLVSGDFHPQSLLIRNDKK